MLRIKDISRFLIPLAIFVLALIIMDRYVGFKMQQSASYQAAAEFLWSNDALPHYCGDLKKIRAKSAKEQFTSDQGTATYEFRVRGVTASADVQLQLRMSGGVWRVEDAELFLRDSASPLSLVVTNVVDRGLASPRARASRTRASLFSLLLPVLPAFWVWAFGVYNLAKLVQRRRVGVSIWTMLNPFTLDAFRGENLTPQALPYRRNVFIALSVFVLVLVISDRLGQW